MEDALMIRVAVSSDRNAVGGLIAAFRDSLQRSGPSDRAILSSLRQLLRDPAVTVGLAVEGKTALGYALQRRHHCLWAQGDAAVLEDLFVLEAACGRGLGRRLVEHAIERARLAGCRALSLDTNEHNEASNAVYRRLGFGCERPRWDGGRQIRYDLAIDSAPPVEMGVRWGPWMVKW